MGRELIPKLFDLTNCFKLKENDYSYSKKPVTSFSAPEVVKGHYSQKSDVWSVAYILYLLITGTSPFNPSKPDKSGGSSFSEDSEQIPKIEFREGAWEGLSQEAIHFFQDVFVYYPAKRLNSFTAMNHQWFNLCKPKSSEKQMEEVKSALKAYKKKSNFEQLITYLICYRVLSEDYRNSLADVFVTLDTNMDGVLSRKDLQQHFSDIDAERII